MHRITSHGSLVSYPESDDDDEAMQSSDEQSGSGNHRVHTVVVSERRGRGRGAVTMEQHDGSSSWARSVGCIQQVADSTSSEAMQISCMKRSAITQDRCRSKTIGGFSNTCKTSTERQVAFVASHERVPGSYSDDKNEMNVKPVNDSSKLARRSSRPEQLIYRPPPMRANSLPLFSQGVPQRPASSQSVTESWDDDLLTVPVTMPQTGSTEQISQCVFETDTKSVRIVELRVENNVNESQNKSSEILDTNVKCCERIVPEVVKVTPSKSAAKLYVPPPMRFQQACSNVSVPLSEIPLPPDNKNYRVGMIGIAHALRTQKDRVEKRNRRSAESLPVSNVKMIVSENDNNDSVFHDDVSKMSSKSLTKVETGENVQIHPVHLPPPNLQKPPVLVVPRIPIQMTFSRSIPSNTRSTCPIQPPAWQLPQYNTQNPPPSYIPPSSLATGIAPFSSLQYRRCSAGSDSTVQESEVSSTSPWQTPDKGDLTTPVNMPVSSKSPALSVWETPDKYNLTTPVSSISPVLSVWETPDKGDLTTPVSSISPVLSVWETPDKGDLTTAVSSKSPALSLSACKISTPSDITSKAFQRYQSNSMPVLGSFKTRTFNASSLHAKRLFPLANNVSQSFPNRIGTSTNFPSVSTNVGDNNTTWRNRIFTSTSPRYGNWKEYISQCQGGSSLSFIDSHCHLDFLFKRIHFQGSFAAYKRQNAETFLDSFEGCVSVFCDPATFTPKGGLWKTLALEDDIWLAMGCHPKYAEQYDGTAEENLKECLRHPKMVAAGEFGLDYSGTFHMSSDVQKIVFTRQLVLSVAMGKPLVIHVRDADDDAFDIMKQYVPKYTKIHRHCFTGPFSEANRWLQEFPNLFIGITPVVTYRSAVGAHDLAQKLPLDRLLLETDAPYFVPQKVNRDEMPYTHPGLAITVAAEVARYKCVTVSEVLKACRKNTYSMYGI